MSGSPINLNKARKKRARDEKKQRANENAVKFGRTKSEREADAAREVMARGKVDAHRRDKDEPEA